MQFSINRQAFIKALNDVSRAISSRTTIPILTNIKIVLTQEELILTGSNSDISIETRIEQSDTGAQLIIKQPGGITLLATFFSNIVKNLPADDMTLSVDGVRASITSGASDFTINGQDVHNYPQLPEMDDVQSLSVSAAQLVDIISQTKISASTQESRPILTGIHLALNGNDVKAVTTDSHRLSQRIVTLTGTDAHVKADVIMPAKSFNELQSLLEGQDRVEIKLAANQAVFDLGNTTFYSRLLEGNYPETDRLIPTESTTQLTIEASALLGAINRASLLSHESRNNVVQLTLENGVVTLIGTSQEVGRVQEELVTKSVEGENLEISFNPDYVRDALRVFNGKAVDIKFTSNLRPFTLTPAGETDDKQLQLITPVRTF
ncbi:MAG: DNA polymerase III subunit beta [Leuconostoc gelidum]|jgi:DNA polymerase-3 subunit beta|uniref:Beta sliding clamp n=1 Tax=Leuconostoc gelidum subsp. gelidum TaxID=1607839 RepID=A0AB35FYF8_LEUGE|nr:DNA polymerase III subunit beta [Leuconostoc gelidum]AFS39451.1 DNA polymerase III subunit beta [Leuconostoc gelidum JB7]MBZ5965086.1 DNA polymerase III subunit beta [Leuconostoc gelidum subsp. gelidum]MBZ5974349.1 DNA polymerase III subunit beta [Leuconostoc gelidum subsp. gelidum]MBZ5977188.1 DNA polymerase III subunit beta [Leuconostoc gelidum subsp. gelidum]MBZ5979520.1 DNA polymerase III subunit beta [Leuconostoc gelidum subsp. gelidum]